MQALKAADRKVLTNAAVEIVGGTPDEFAAFIRAEMDRVGKVIKSASFTN